MVLPSGVFFMRIHPSDRNGPADFLDSIGRSTERGASFAYFVRLSFFGSEASVVKPGDFETTGVLRVSCHMSSKYDLPRAQA